ncbi:hypothetical protein U9M48_020761 [Paspalum notatum var. saurae]|uniref:DUF7769 domain-containing protein n=1 Tax=Paspalum notatum var. saurae TaxID=547442 RepID=A0AAQ3TGW8_PASNO
MAVISPFDLNLSPQPLFDLNEDPPEEYGGEAFTEHQLISCPSEYTRRVHRDFDLNMPLQQETEEDQSVHEASNQGHHVQYGWKKELSNDKRKQLYEALLWRCTSKGRLTREIVEEVAASFSFGAYSDMQDNVYDKACTCYLLPDEEEPYRTCKNKNFIKKTVMLEVMKVGGGNNYKTPHINKASLEREEIFAT